MTVNLAEREREQVGKSWPCSRVGGWGLRRASVKCPALKDLEKTEPSKDQVQSL